MDIGYGAPEIVTGEFICCYYDIFTPLGGRDGCVRLWDPRVNEPVLALEPSDGQPARDCWTVAFGDSEPPPEINLFLLMLCFCFS